MLNHFVDGFQLENLSWMVHRCISMLELSQTLGMCFSSSHQSKCRLGEYSIAAKIPAGYFLIYKMNSQSKTRAFTTKEALSFLL